MAPDISISAKGKKEEISAISQGYTLQEYYTSGVAW